jgi:hypothetical protein
MEAEILARGTQRDANQFFNETVQCDRHIVLRECSLKNRIAPTRDVRSTGCPVSARPLGL